MSLILIGAGPHAGGVEQLRPLLAGGFEEYITIMEHSGQMPEHRKAQMLANDLDALDAILNSP